MNWYKTAVQESGDWPIVEKVKLPKGWKVTVKKHYMEGIKKNDPLKDFHVYYVPHFWFEGQYKGHMPTTFDYASKAKEQGSKYLLGVLSGEL